MFTKSPAERYHAAVKKLTQAEDRHRAAVVALDEALQARRAMDVPRLRKVACETWHAANDALQAAAVAHRAYWQHRRDELAPQVRDAAQLMRRFDLIARAAGDSSVTPAWTLISAERATPAAVEFVEDVPTDVPDSDLLDENAVFSAKLH